jgi:hypothetical protein
MMGAATSTTFGATLAMFFEVIAAKMPMQIVKGRLARPVMTGENPKICCSYRDR